MQQQQPRARLGVVLPSVNTVVEPWFNSVLPADVTLHATRMLLSDELTAQALRKMDHEEGMEAVTRIKSCRPSAVAYCCTASSVVQGLAYDAQLQAALEARAGVPCFTAVGALVEALRALDVRKISIASPYTDAIDHAEKELFEAAGFKVCGAANLGIADSFELASPTARDITELAARAWSDDSDALLISCLNLNSQQVVDMLERQLGKPVVTSTTATLWKLLRSAGVHDRIEGYGRLFAIQ